MADFNSSLPIRSEADGADARVHVKIVDGTTPAQRATVDTDGNVHVENHGNDPTGTDRVIRTSEQGHTAVNGIYDAADNTDPSNIALIAHSRDDTPGDSQATERLTSVEDSSGAVRSLDVSIHDGFGEAYSDANPMPVYLANDPGDEIIDYDTASAIAGNATSNHVYSIAAGTTFELFQIQGSASGKMKMEVQYSNDGFTSDINTICVMFNSTSNPNCDFALAKPFIIVGGATVSIRIVRTNRDLQAQDVYSSIVGVLKT